MISEKERNKLAIFGGVAGLATPFLLQYIAMPILNWLGSWMPQLSLKLAGTNPVISVNIRESLTGINGGLSGWLVDALGLTISVPFMTYIMGALGGAILCVAGAYLADAIGLLKGDGLQKTRMVIWAGSLIAAFILGGMAVPAIGISLVNTLIAFGVNAAIIAYIYVVIDKQFKIGLMPF